VIFPVFSPHTYKKLFKIKPYFHRAGSDTVPP